MTSFENAVNQTLCKINDNLTQMKFLEQARNVRDNNIYFFTIPENGGTRVFTVGTTKVDFVTGTIVNPDGTAERLKHSLSQYKLEFVHSLSIDVNQDVILRVNDSPKRTITSGFNTQIPWLTFNFIEIECTKDTNIVLFACTNPQAVIGQFNQLIKGNHSGTQIIVATDVEGRMLVTPTYSNPVVKDLFYNGYAVAPHGYTERAIYTVPAGKAAVLYGGSVRIRIATAAGTPSTRVVGIGVEVGGGAVWQVFSGLSAIHNTIGQSESNTMSIGMPLQAGHKVLIHSADFSTGGTCEIKGVASVMEYDA